MTDIPVDAAVALDAPFPPRRLARRIGWGVVAFLSVGVGAYAAFLIATGFRFVPDEVAANHFPTVLGLRTHIVASAVALVVGPFQFLRPLRRRVPKLHHWFGRVYLVACAVGGLAGGLIALFSTSGLVAGVGFLGLALSWLFCSGRAYVAVRRHDYLNHERWMIRSFALTFAAVTLRIYIPGAMIAGLGFAQAYPVIAWAAWVPNLLVAQLLVRKARGAADF